MDRRVLCGVLVLVVIVSACSAEDNSFEGCLRRDSISCVQQHVYRKLRALFGQDTINLIGGFQLVKNNDETSSRSLEDNTIDDKVLGKEDDVSERQAALEEFAYQRITNLFTERSVKWGVTPALDQLTTTARMAASTFPQELREKFTNYVIEGRGKKKMMKSLIPILIMAKVKLMSMAGLAYVVIGAIAKKALVASTVALIITLYISIKKLLTKHHHTPIIHPEHYHHPVPHAADRSSWAPAWSGSSSSSGWDTYDNHASQHSHSLAYSASKPMTKEVHYMA